MFLHAMLRNLLASPYFALQTVICCFSQLNFVMYVLWKSLLLVGTYFSHLFFFGGELTLVWWAFPTLFMYLMSRMMFPVSANDLRPHPLSESAWTRLNSNSYSETLFAIANHHIKETKLWNVIYFKFTF